MQNIETVEMTPLGGEMRSYWFGRHFRSTAPPLIPFNEPIFVHYLSGRPLRIVDLVSLPFLRFYIRGEICLFCIKKRFIFFFYIFIVLTHFRIIRYNFYTMLPGTSAPTVIKASKHFLSSK